MKGATQPLPQTGGTRKRSFYYSWCDILEEDEVCLACLAILVDGLCLHCQRKNEKKKASLQDLASRASSLTSQEKRAQWKKYGAAYRLRKKQLLVGQKKNK